MPRRVSMWIDSDGVIVCKGCGILWHSMCFKWHLLLSPSSQILQCSDIEMVIVCDTTKCDQFLAPWARGRVERSLWLVQANELWRAEIWIAFNRSFRISACFAEFCLVSRQSPLAWTPECSKDQSPLGEPNREAVKTNTKPNQNKTTTRKKPFTVLDILKMLGDVWYCSSTPSTQTDIATGRDSMGPLHTCSWLLSRCVFSTLQFHTLHS